MVSIITDFQGPWSDFKNKMTPLLEAWLKPAHKENIFSHSVLYQHTLPYFEEGTILSENRKIYFLDEHLLSVNEPSAGEIRNNGGNVCED